MSILKSDLVTNFIDSKLFFIYLGLVMSLFYYLVISDHNIGIPMMFLSILGFSLPVGYLALYPLRRQFKIPNIGMVPFYLSVGFILNYVWVLSLSPFTLNSMLLFSLFQISVVIIFYLKLKEYLLKKNSLKLSSGHTPNFSISTIEFKKWKIVTSLFLISMILFITIVERYPNPLEYSDIVTYHSVLAQAILEHSNLSPYLTDAKILDSTARISTTIAYPIGFHVNLVGYSELFDLQLSQTAQLILTVSTLLIFGVLLSISYFVTRSVLITISTMMVFFHLQFPRSDQSSVFFQIMDGGGTIQLSTLCLVSGMFLLLSINQKHKPSFLILLSLLFLGTGLAYPPMGVYFLIWAIAYLLVNFSKIKQYTSKLYGNVFHKPNFKSFNILHLIVIVLMIGIVVGEIYIIQFNIVNSANFELAKSSFSAGYTFNTEATSTEKYFLPILILASMINLFYFKKYRFYTLAMFLTFMIAITVSNFNIYPVYFTPIRIDNLLVTATWIILGITISQTRSSFLSRYNHDNDSNIKNCSNKKSKKLYYLLWNYSPLIFLIITIIIFLPDMIKAIDMNSIYYKTLQSFNPR